ncbi:MAG TPA: hypothetical protein VEZ47_01615 [Gemmatirosa sp.]|nr:hypothetical protein [Gemmatirosa sp.]
MHPVVLPALLVQQQFQLPSVLPSDGFAAYGAVLAAVVVLGLALFFARCYKRADANQILVISGRRSREGENARCINGGGALVIPILEGHGYLSLEPMDVPVKLEDALSLENIRISVPSVFTIAIGTEPEYQQNAAARLLGKTSVEMAKIAEHILVGQLRAVIATLSIDEINRDRDAFRAKVQHQLEPELKKLGLVLINSNLQDLRDQSGYLDALGKQAAQQAIQKARGDVADQEKLGEIRVAQAKREKEVAVADAEKERQIALAETTRQQAVRLAELDRERQIGEQTAALERDAAIREAQRTQATRVATLDKEQKVAERTAELERDAAIAQAQQLNRVAMAEANARAVQGEAEAKKRIAATNADVAVAEAMARQTAETSRARAEATIRAETARAGAEAAEADALRVEAERRAEMEAPAKAEAARLIVEAQALAEKRRLEAEAEAAAVFARLDAEARGQLEIASKKAEGIRQMVAAAGGDPDAAFRLMMIEHLPRIAETAATAISNIKFDKVVVWEGGNATGDGSAVGGSAGFIQSLARSMPPMMQVLRDVAGVEVPGFLGTMRSELHAGEPIGAPVAVPPSVATPASPTAQANGEARVAAAPADGSMP